MTTNDLHEESSSMSKVSQDRNSDDAPAISIVIPVWNRSGTIRRCLDSIFCQDFDNYEVIAVDDASEDDTVAIMESYGNPKLQVHRLEKNVGVCAARGVGTQDAKAPWILYVDSDWALEPGVLERLHRRTQDVPDDVGVLGFMCQTPDGLTPNPPYPEGPFGFAVYLQEENRRMKCRKPSRDFLYCLRGTAVTSSPWHEDRRFESSFFIPFVSRWKFDVSHEIGAAIYFDAPNRYTAQKPDIDRVRLVIGDGLKGSRITLREFGEDLQRHAPLWYATILRGAGSSCFSLGRRWEGLKYMSRYFVRRPFSLRGWMMLVLGLLGPSIFMRARRFR